MAGTDVSSVLGVATAVSPLVTVPPLRTYAGDAIDADPEIATLPHAQIVDRIARLRRDRNAVILAHNYQLPDVQDVADVVGDSLQLARHAAATDADVIVFCGVHFMAETAAVICPGKRVLIPDPSAECSLAASITAGQLRAWKADHPGAVVVAYVNTAAEVKAEADYCCTSSNAAKVISAVPPDREILFLPDQFLGVYLRQVTGREMHLWPGACHVHAAIGIEEVFELLDRHPTADLLLHPECGCIGGCLAAVADGRLPAERTHVLSTGGMVAHARACSAPVELIGTETGLLHRLRQDSPTKQFIPLRADAVCAYMKTIDLAKLYRSLRDDVYPVTVPPATAGKARDAIDRMLACV